MGDPLSIAGSLVGLYELADKVFIRIVRYVKAVKEAKKEVQELSDELQSLSVALHQLYLRTSKLEVESEANGISSSARPHFIDSCYQLLLKLKVRLEKASPAGDHLTAINSAQLQLKWPFSTSETKSLLNALERHKSTVVLAVGTENLAAIEKLLSAQEQLAEELHDVKAAIEQRRAFELKFESLFSDKDRNDVLGFFAKVSPTKRHQTSKGLRHPNTGLWVLEADEFQDWLGDDSNKLWFSGIPGAGKTVLASSLIEETTKYCESLEKGVAYFYCDYKDEASQDPINILGSLAAQLAQQSIESFEALRELYQRCRRDLANLRLQTCLHS